MSQPTNRGSQPHLSFPESGEMRVSKSRTKDQAARMTLAIGPGKLPENYMGRE